MDDSEFKHRVQDEIEKFAHSSDIPYDRPNPLLNFETWAKGWKHVNAYCMARLSVLAYQDFGLIKERLSEADIKASDVCWFENKSTDTQGFGFIWDGNIFLCFRGTESMRVTIIDIKRKQVNFDNNNTKLGSVHQGFSEATISIWPDVEKFLKERAQNKPVWVTGHSLGGAIATIIAARIVHNEKVGNLAALYTFGQPRVGNKKFHKEFTKKIGGQSKLKKQVFRIYRAADPVPMMPYFGYTHISGERCYIARSGEMTIGTRRKQKYLDRAITYLTVLPRVLTEGGRINELKSLVSDHYSSGYLKKLRENLFTSITLKTKDD